MRTLDRRNVSLVSVVKLYVCRRMINLVASLTDSIIAFISSSRNATRVPEARRASAEMASRNYYRGNVSIQRVAFY